MGPPPKPASQRRRQNATFAMTALPAEGRQGDAPDFPLPPLFLKDDEYGALQLHERELELWTDLWTTPQAVMWERTHAALAVARFARFSAFAERGDLKAATEARQLEDRLGLNPQALLRLRWEIAGDEVGARRAEAEAAAKPKRKPRLRVIDPEAASGAVAGA